MITAPHVSVPLALPTAPVPGPTVGAEHWSAQAGAANSMSTVQQKIVNAAFFVVAAAIDDLRYLFILSLSLFS
jgi:hypothetical protein